MPEIQTTTLETIKASQLQETTSISDSNYIVVTDGVTSKKAKATLLKGKDGAAVTIINDLTTGGIDKALSAEQGKVIGLQLDSIATSLNNKTSKEYVDDLIEEVLSNIGSSNPTYEIQDKTLKFGSGNTIQLSTDVQDCICNINFSLDSSSDVPVFTNLFPYVPLSSAPNSVNGIQGYKGTREFIGDNIVKFTATEDGAILKSMINPSKIIANHKYLYRSLVSSDGLNYEVNKNFIIVANSDGTITNGTNIIVNITEITNGTILYLKNLLVLDLTEMYGEGSEPTKEEMLINIPKDIWSSGTYNPSGENEVFTITSKDQGGTTIDTYVSSSSDKTLNIVSGGIVEADGKQPTNTSLTNVKTKVLVNNNSISVSSKNTITLNNVDRLLFVGDSYTEGMYYQKGKAWVCQLSEQLDYTCESYGFGGYTSETLTENIQNNVARYNPIAIKKLNPTRAMIMTFVNDMVKFSYDNTKYLNSMRKLTKEIEYLGAKPIICTEFRAPWGYGLQQNLNIFALQNGYDFYNILPYTNFLGTVTASDDEAMSPYYNGSHPGQRTGGIIFNQYLRYCKNLPRPISAIKIYRKRSGITINTLSDLMFSERREKLLKFKEINISHSSLSNDSDWDKLDNMTGTAVNGVTSEYGKLMANQNVIFNDYALIEVILPTVKNNIKSAKLCIDNTSVAIYVKSQNNFIVISDGVVEDLENSIEYDKITFLLYKEGGFSLNDVYLEWSGNETPKSETPKRNIFPKGATELLSINTFGTDTSWYTTIGTISVKEPTNYSKMPTGCTKLITVTNENYINVAKTIQSSLIVGNIDNLRLRIVARYNPDKNSTLINENSYDRKRIKIELKGATIGATVNRYTQYEEVDMAWTMCEFDLTATDNFDVNILSEDVTPLEICYISLLKY